MANNMTIREFIYRDIWTFAVEERYKDQLCKIMEDNVIKFKVKNMLHLPDSGWFYVIETWTAGDIGPVKYAIEHILSELRHETKVED